MHYKNGREAKVGDKAIVIYGDGGNAHHGTIGVLHSVYPGAPSCNGSLAPLAGSQSVTIGECLHLDDALALLNPPKEPDPDLAT